MNAVRHFLERFNRQETAVNPDETIPVEETQDAADSPPAEETIIDVPDTPVEEPVLDVPATPVAPPPPSLDMIIASGAIGIQDALSAYRMSKTAEHDADMALTSARAEAQRILAEAQARIEATDGAEDAALAEVNDAIDAQVANLTALKTTLNS